MDIKQLQSIEKSYGKSRYLQFNHLYDAAFSTCKTCLFLLPKIVITDTGYVCRVKSIITTKAIPDYEIMLNQTLVALELPRQWQLDNHILTPLAGEEWIELPVVWLEDRMGWSKPVFKNMDLEINGVNVDD
jgi:hypothetical protein